jgi:putative RecB family exonuclease
MLDIFANTQDLTVRPVDREAKATAKLLSGQRITGRIDRIDANSDGMLDVVDYKTGTYILSPTQLAQNRPAWLYTMLAEGLRRVSVSRVRYVYLRVGIEIVWHPSYDEKQAIKAWAFDVVQRIETDQVFEPNPGPHCASCPLYQNCNPDDLYTPTDLVNTDELPF